MHRALAQFRLDPMNFILVVLLSCVWLVLLPQVCDFWHRVLLLGFRFLPLHGDLGLARHHLTGFISFQIPYPRMEPLLPSPQVWWITCAVTLALFASSFLLSGHLIPLRSLLRGVLLVPATALLYFVFLPASFPHTPDSYMKGFVTSGVTLISIVPLLFGLTYYIFPFGLMKKLFLTALTMTHLALFLPLQVLLQALLLQKTVLFMPVLYIIFGMPVNILITVAFYSWGMTWLFKSAKRL
jgi:hypothetical protein